MINTPELIIYYKSTNKGVDIINGEYPPGVFLRGLKFSGKKIRGLKFLVKN